MKAFFLTLLLSSFALPLSSAVAPPPATQPNILFILADDLGWTGLSCYGNKDVATPNLDRLATQGMRFTQAYADAQCSPTRAAFLSGQYGGRTGLFKVIAEKEPPKAYMRPPVTNLEQRVCFAAPQTGRRKVFRQLRIRFRGGGQSGGGPRRQNRGCDYE